MPGTFSVPERKPRSADPRRSVDLVGAGAHQVDLPGNRVDGQLAEALHRIHMEHGLRCGLMDDPSDPVDGLDQTRLIIDVHTGDKADILIHGFFQCFQQHFAIFIDWKICDLEAFFGQAL